MEDEGTVVAATSHKLEMRVDIVNLVRLRASASPTFTNRAGE
jgi:hypothetical protein